MWNFILAVGSSGAAVIVSLVALIVTVRAQRFAAKSLKHEDVTIYFKSRGLRYEIEVDPDDPDSALDLAKAILKEDEARGAGTEQEDPGHAGRSSFTTLKGDVVFGDQRRSGDDSRSEPPRPDE